MTGGAGGSSISWDDMEATFDGTNTTYPEAFLANFEGGEMPDCPNEEGGYTIEVRNEANNQHTIEVRCNVNAHNEAAADAGEGA